MRTSFTLWQSSYPMGNWSARKFRTAYVTAADHGPGHDAQAGIKLIGLRDIAPDDELPNMGDVPIGVITMFHYSVAGSRPANKVFVDAYKTEYGANAWPNLISVGAWDAMQAIFDAVRAQGGKIDPATRDIVQNEDVREVRKVGGVLANVELETIPAVKDPWKEFNRKP